jgi:hypothetical protein
VAQCKKCSTKGEQLDIHYGTCTNQLGLRQSKTCPMKACTYETPWLGIELLFPCTLPLCFLKRCYLSTLVAFRFWWFFFIFFYFFLFLLRHFSCTALFGWICMREGNLVYECTSHPSTTIGLWSFCLK